MPIFLPFRSLRSFTDWVAMIENTRWFVTDWKSFTLAPCETACTVFAPSEKPICTSFAMSAAIERDELLMFTSSTSRLSSLK